MGSNIVQVGPNLDKHARSAIITHHKDGGKRRRTRRKESDGLDKEKLKELAQDKRFISGIYNYCDRWCERCPQTSRCLNYAMAEDEFTDPKTQDIHNEAFWTKLSETFRATLDLVKEMAASEDIDLDALDPGEFVEEKRAFQEAAKNHEIARAARAYADMAENWFEGARAFFEGGEVTDPSFQSIPGNVEEPERNGVEEVFEVVQWYQHQIYVKLARAISGQMEEESEIDDELAQYAKDSEGSAKVALIGLDRSIAAWGILGRRVSCFPQS